jgi:23S rRNA (cytosine1962-C5)-methyltransferase
VNLDAYLDTGLFLDHRITRAMVRERAAGKRFLNLFAYTGSFTVYAAAGGAASSLTVDLSKTYQAWSARNLELNNIDTGQHRLLQDDVLAFLKDAASQGPQYDLIVMDPPSFSNSKRMTDTLDVQRDHPELIRLCMQLLAAEGELFFSNNRRGFKLDPAIEQQFDSRDITRQTLPEDFRARGAHQCWLIKHR